VGLRNSGFTLTVVFIDNPTGYAQARGALESAGVRVLHVGSEADLSAIGF